MGLIIACSVTGIAGLLMTKRSLQPPKKLPSVIPSAVEDLLFLAQRLDDNQLAVLLTVGK